VVIAWHFWRRRPADDWAANAGFLAAAVVGTPYLLGYDTIALSVAALLALAQQPVNRFAVLGCWLLVIVQMVLGEAGLPGSALIPAFAALSFLGLWRPQREKALASSTCVDQRNCPTGLTQSSE
jgi:hypothetical protein